MKRCIVILLVILGATNAFSQIRFDKLEIEARQTYFIERSDILVVDTLVMRDSSRIVLNRERKENIINVKVLLVTGNAQIVGHGANGIKGKLGINGLRQGAPCRAGGNASEGGSGGKGIPGTSLSLYTNQLVIIGTLTIDLNGGNGGAGGDGGNGGDGGGGTRVCRGGNGGAGGRGGNGGDGGNGGNLTITCRECESLYVMQGHQLFIKNYGGYGGVGATGGNGGQAGLGSKQDGRNGSRGLPGVNGVAGKPGTTRFEKK
ncbi:MAG: hypothetical protein ACKO96_06720 [Flammeovirgaceae bacterium]